MAYFQGDFFSPALATSTNINVIIPTPNSDELLTGQDMKYFHPGIKYPVLYLLHGAFGDYSDWMRMTSIEKYAQRHRIAVVMPSVGNSFYQDMYMGPKYLTYISDELPRFIQTIFPVSGKPEDTFIAGLSMGGYGALRVAFGKPENYAACATMSGAVDLPAQVASPPIPNAPDTFYWKAIFENPDAVASSDADLFTLAKKRLDEGRKLPPVFQTIGTEDILYEQNVRGRDRFRDIGVDVTYIEHPGIHDWDFWDARIQDVLDWLPIRKSGNPE